MKKTIPFLLCIFMMFLLCSAAFAEGAEETPAQFENAGALFQHWMANAGNGQSPYPAYVCGVWSTDGTEKNLTIAVTKDEAGEAGKAEILAAIADKSTVTFTYQAYTFAELWALQQTLQERMGEETGVYGVGVYESENCVMISIDEENPNAEAFMHECFERYGDRVRFEAGSGAYVMIEDIGITLPGMGADRGLVASPWFWAAFAGILLLAALLMLRQRKLAATHAGAGTAALHSNARITRREAEAAVREAELTPPPTLDAAILEAADERAKP